MWRLFIDEHPLFKGNRLSRVGSVCLAAWGGCKVFRLRLQLGSQVALEEPGGVAWRHVECMHGGEGLVLHRFRRCMPYFTGVMASPDSAEQGMIFQRIRPW